MSQGSANRLDGIPFLKSLTDAELRDVEKRCRWRRFDEGKQILDKDSDDRDVYFVVQGGVQIVNFSMSGREIAFAQLDAGTYFSEAVGDRRQSALGDGAGGDELPAGGDAGPGLHLAGGRHPDLATHVLHRLTAIVRSCDERIMDLSTLGAVQRVYLEVLRLAEKNEPEDPAAEWAISPIPTHKAIAGQASTTRETVARSMSQLVAADVIERRGNTISLRDVERLGELAGALDGDMGGVSR